MAVMSKCKKHDVEAREEYCFVGGCRMIPCNPLLAAEVEAEVAGDYI